MKKILFAMSAGLFLLSFLSAQANPIPVNVLPVYDDNGNKVSSLVVSAYGEGPVSGIAKADINISATVKESLNVSLSATNINWNIKKRGNYMTPAIAITTNRGVVNMAVTGANNLTADTTMGTDSNELLTSYCLIPQYDVISNQASPQPSQFVEAKYFNGSHRLYNYHSVLWNRLQLGEAKIAASTSSGSVIPQPVPDSYHDTFTVTFSALL